MAVLGGEPPSEYRIQFDQHGRNHPAGESRRGFQFGQPYQSQHGSLTLADAVVPVAFGYPGGVLAGDKDTVLAPIRQLFGSDPAPGQPTPTLDQILEAPAIRAFFHRQ